MALGTLGVGSTVAAEDVKSQWDGIYTAEQAKRGDALYAEHCASCHGGGLTGGEMAPALTGGEFTANWNDLSIGDLFDRMRISMPQDQPGSLTRQQNADVLAYILSKMNAPAGKTELPGATDELKAIKFLAQSPKAK
ncbi:MAG: c-type cytochrome [Vicinamibacterales bacterium]